MTMKKISKNLLIGIAVIAVLVVSCKKDTLESTSSKADPAAVNKLFDQLDPARQTFNIDPTEPNTIKGKDGMVIQIPANALVDANGNPVSGNVTVSLKEMLSLRDQILTGVTATSDGKILKSGGEFFFEVRDANGQKLNVGSNKSVTFEIPSNNVDSTMKVFVGVDSVTIENQKNQFDWKLADSTLKNMVVDSVPNPNKDSLNPWVLDSSFVPDCDMQYLFDKYIITVTNLYGSGYYNVDRYVDYSTIEWHKTCQVNVLGNTDKEDVDFTLKVVYKKYSSVGWFTNSGVVTTTMEIDTYEEWVTGEDVIVVVIGVGKKSNKTYFGKTELKIAADSKPVISISSVSNDELMAALSNL